ncbi:MAG: DUF262 domain-containing protein [Nitrosopumilus sp.]|nr:DUF262 domain-containing protein [Nitrosopumilus sp.]
MKIELKEINVEELVQDYVDNVDEGVLGYGGRLNIRPAFQREFVYKPAQRNAVIDTVTKNFPLNVMYWAVQDDGNFEIIDGQQRTISICKYVTGEFTYKERFFHNLQDDEQQQILNYKLMIYWCSGTDSERLNWFKTINIAGEPLSDQELRNAVYSGPWVSDAKRYFSKMNSPAFHLANSYVNAKVNRQEYLETAIKWISDNKITEYMGIHQHDQNANVLWDYFKSIIDWIEITFKVKRQQMKGVDWGILYKNYKDEKFDTDDLEKQLYNLIIDDEVTNNSGIYPYVLTGDKRHLSLRTFPDIIKQKVYELQMGRCKNCEKEFDMSRMEADHITPWHEGGKTTEENCQMLCKDCNRRKSGK